MNTPPDAMPLWPEGRRRLRRLAVAMAPIMIVLVVVLGAILDHVLLAVLIGVPISLAVVIPVFGLHVARSPAAWVDLAAGTLQIGRGRPRPFSDVSFVRASFTVESLAVTVGFSERDSTTLHRGNLFAMTDQDVVLLCAVITASSVPARSVHGQLARGHRVWVGRDEVPELVRSLRG